MLKWDSLEQIAKEAEARGDMEAAKRARAAAEAAKLKALEVLPRKITQLEKLLEQHKDDEALAANLKTNIAKKKAILESITPRGVSAKPAEPKAGDDKTTEEGDINE